MTYGGSRDSQCLSGAVGRVIVVWLSWLIGGVCGVVILLVVICYCRLMPRQQKSFDEQYLKETHAIKESKSYRQDGHRAKHTEAQVHRHGRPVSYGGSTGGRRPGDGAPAPPATRSGSGDAARHVHYETKGAAAQYASSSMLDGVNGSANADALKTRSLPAFHRPKPRPLSTEDDLQQLYAKVNLSKKYKNRMRNEHAAIIALSKSHSQYLDADAVIVYDQRTAL